MSFDAAAADDELLMLRHDELLMLRLIKKSLLVFEIFWGGFAGVLLDFGLR